MFMCVYLSVPSSSEGSKIGTTRKITNKKVKDQPTKIFFFIIWAEENPPSISLWHKPASMGDI